MQSTETPSPDDVYRVMTIELVDALKKIFPNGAPNYAGLVLLHSAIDIISSLSRPISSADTSGEVFKSWVNAYMLPDSSLNCSAADIWGARCGILHTLSLSSRGSRTKKAKSLSFLNKQSGVARLQEICNRRGHDTVIVAIPTYRRAFFKGILRFTEQIQTDENLRNRVFHHLKNVSLGISFDLHPRS